MLIAILLTVGLMLYGCLLLADWLHKYIGETGQIIMTRLLGIILAALSVQFVADGAKNLFN